jgi:DNA-binding transcriptional ArsR family regulator
MKKSSVINIEKTIYSMHADICKALSNPIRVEIVHELRGGELGFGELLEITGMSKSNLSQHLSLLMDKGLIFQRKDGINKHFRLTSEKVAEACQTIREVIKNQLINSNLILNSIE